MEEQIAIQADVPDPTAKMIAEFEVVPDGRIRWNVYAESNGECKQLGDGIEDDIHTAIAKFHLRAIRGLRRM